MDRADEAHALVDLFRQYDEGDRRNLLAEMVEIAADRLVRPPNKPLPLEPPSETGYGHEIREHLLAISRRVRSSGKSSRADRAAAMVIDLGAWSLGGGAIDPLRFASVAIAWSWMDTKGGRQIGAVRRQFEELASQHPDVPTKALLRLPEAAGLELGIKNAQNLRSGLRSRQLPSGNR